MLGCPSIKDFSQVLEWSAAFPRDISWLMVNYLNYEATTPK